tara:strand:- start:235 stop:558 length:324 start_codon:yes stop_codon:yes gene_type:complete
MQNSKVTTNQKLKKELFSLNQLVKFSTKGDGKEYIKTYISEKKLNVTLKELTVANLAGVMTDNVKFTRKKNIETGKFELTNEKRVKFSTWHILTLIDKLSEKNTMQS